MQIAQLIQTQKLYTRFVLSLIVLNLFLFASGFETYLELPKSLKYFLSLIAFYFIIKLFNKSQRLQITNIIDSLVRNIFIFVSIFLLLFSFRFEFLYIQEIFGERFYFMPFLTPIIFLLIRYNLLFFKVMLKYSYYLLFGGILVQLIILLYFTDMSFYYRGLTAMLTFAITPFLLIQISHLYDSKMVGRIALLYLLLFAIVTAIWGRRGETLEPLFFIVSAFIIKASSIDMNINNKLLFFIFGMVFSISAYFILITYQNKLLIFERGFSRDSWDQSRGETIDNFLYDFGSKPYDLFIGRGLNGELRKFSSGKNQVSRSIEIGYFNILLKGGLLYLIPMMYLFLRAFYLGFFRSNNDLSKGLAMIVLWQMIYMVSFGMANYSPFYIILWIAVGAGFDSNLRGTSNFELRRVFKQH